MTEKPTASLTEALAMLQQQLPVIPRDRTADAGGKFSYKFADLADVSRVVLPLLGPLGLAWVCRPTMSGDRFVVAYELRHVSGECIGGEFPVPAGLTAQATGSWLTYIRRYAMSAVLGVVTEVDDDGALTTPTPAKRAPARKAAAPKMISDPQLHLIMKLFGDAGYGDSKEERVRRLRYCTQIVGRPLDSSKDLTQREAAAVIDALQESLAEPYEEQPS